jgi:hypothetical protein
MKFFGNFDNTEQDLMRFTTDNEQEILLISIKDACINHSWMLLNKIY